MTLEKKPFARYNEEKPIEFNSSPEYYKKEESGIKPNTVRNIDISDKRFQLLIWHMINKTNPEITIKSIHGHKFTRKSKDISVWGNFIIISWCENDT